MLFLFSFSRDFPITITTQIWCTSSSCILFVILKRYNGCCVPKHIIINMPTAITSLFSLLEDNHRIHNREQVKSFYSLTTLAVALLLLSSFIIVVKILVANSFVCLHRSTSLYVSILSWFAMVISYSEKRRNKTNNGNHKTMSEKYDK